MAESLWMSKLLTCTRLSIIRFTHPLMAFTQWPVEFARLCHLADAGATVTLTSTAAQFSSWDLTPALRFSLGQSTR